MDEMIGKIDTTDKFDKIDTTDKFDKTDKTDRIDTIDTTDKVKKIETVEKIDKTKKHDSKNNRTRNIILGVVCIAAPLVVGGISAILSGDQMKSFGELNQPPLSPPAWLFPVAWTILYILMGIALLLIVRSKHEYKVGAICLFISQLLMNGLWSPLFFVKKEYMMAFIVLVTMLMTTVILTLVTRKINRTAALLFLPYIAWMLFASYLNAAIVVLNT